MKLIRQRQLLAKIGGVSSMTLWRWERDGRFPRRFKIGLSAVAWSLDAVDEWIEAKAKIAGYDAQPGVRSAADRQKSRAGGKR